MPGLWHTGGGVRPWAHQGGSRWPMPMPGHYRKTAAGEGGHRPQHTQARSRLCCGWGTVAEGELLLKGKVAATKELGRVSGWGYDGCPVGGRGTHKGPLTRRPYLSCKKKPKNTGCVPTRRPGFLPGYGVGVEPRIFNVQGTWLGSGGMGLEVLEKKLTYTPYPRRFGVAAQTLLQRPSFGHSFPARKGEEAPNLTEPLDVYPQRVPTIVGRG